MEGTSGPRWADGAIESGVTGRAGVARGVTCSADDSSDWVTGRSWSATVSPPVGGSAPGSYEG